MHSTDSTRPLPPELLADRVRGPVFRPGEEGYDAERAGFQTAGSHQPAVIVGAVDAGDVRAAVRFAGAHGLPVAVQATGHGLVAAGSGGVLISTRRMSTVRVDAEARSARVGAGTTWNAVIPEAARHGLAPLNGSSPHVGVVSYTLGGGLGLLSRQYGYAADHVRLIDVVTADGRLRRVTPTSDPDLFWALRGGQGNFGVVTGVEIGLMPVSRLYGGVLMFDTELVEDLLHSYLRWTAVVPEELTSSVALVGFPDVPALPGPLRGRHVTQVRIVFTGHAAEGERLVAPLRAVGPRLVDSLRDMPYAESSTIHNDPTEPHAYRGDGLLLRDLDAPALAPVLALAGPTAPVRCVVQLNHLGGALSRPSTVTSAVGHRDARFLLRVLSPLDGADAGAVESVHRDLREALAPWTSGRSLNFAFGEPTADHVRSGYDAEDFRRPRTLKAVHDPGNMFRHNHNIPPAASTG